jgi:hypothetical protein
MTERVQFSADEAMERLEIIQYDQGDGLQPHVHTFRVAGGMMLGAHWGAEDLRKAIEKHGVELAGPEATAMRHGLVMVDETGPVFLETREVEDEEAVSDTAA